MSRCKVDSFENKIKNTRNVSRESWRVVRSLTTEPKNTDNLTLVDSDKLITDPKEIANIFNSVFVGKNDDRNAVELSGHHEALSEGEVLRGIGQKSSAGCGEVPCHLLNDCGSLL